MQKKIISSILLGLALIVLTGCAHYRLGDGSKLEYKSISFEPVINTAFIPQAQSYVSEALAEAFMEGGKLTVEPAGKGDVLLQITLKDYRKEIGATRSSDTGTARSLSATLTAQAVLRKADGTVLYTENFDANEEIYADSGLNRAETQAIPLLAKDLAQKIYRATVSRW